MKKLIPIVLILAAVGGGGAWLYANRGEKEPTVNVAQISRGDIIEGVGATGTLQAVTTVTVGTQVSGIVQDLYADFNDIVTKGKVIARLDPSILETQVETAKANLVNAQANLERQKVAVADAESKLVRAKELASRQLINKVDLENAEVTLKQAEAQLKSTQSSIVQAEASVNKAQVDLAHTVITAPIDGIIIKRSVDKGQTVAASMSAPELFIIAADLTKMQVNASIDESEVGRMRPGQVVTFRVDAYPTETFHGMVKQVRLNPTTVQNVVTYSTVIDVPNPDYKLKPGMTANVTIEVARRENALRVPNSALRFRPTKDIFDALHQAMPPELERGFGRGQRNGQRNAGGTGTPGQPGAPDAGAGSGAPRGGTPAATAGTQPPAAAGQSAGNTAQRQPRAGGDNQGQRPRNGQGPGQSNGQSNGPRPEGQNAANGGGQGSGGQGTGGQGGRGGFANMTPEERQKRMEERMASMTPEERAQFQERLRQRQANGGGNFGGGRGGNGAGQGMGQGQGGGNGQGNFQRNGQSGQNAQNGQGAGQNQGSRRGQLQGQVASNSPSKLTSATTIDALFAPLQPQETRGRAWLFINKQQKPVELRLGISDGTFTEILNDPAELQPNTEVVTAVITPEMANRPAGTQQNNQSNNPLMPQRGRGPGGPGGGGGGRGGGR